MTSCPCGSGEPYPACCGRFHAGSAQPPTAEALLRARYSAFAVGDADFLTSTGVTGPGPVLEDGLSWTGLAVLECEQGGLFAATGTVRFVARYTRGGERGSVEETSRFARVDGRWHYLGPAG